MAVTIEQWASLAAWSGSVDDFAVSGGFLAPTGAVGTPNITRPVALASERPFRMVASLTRSANGWLLLGVQGAVDTLAVGVGDDGEVIGLRLGSFDTPPLGMSLADGDSATICIEADALGVSFAVTTDPGGGPLVASMWRPWADLGAVDALFVIGGGTGLRLDWIGVDDTGQTIAPRTRVEGVRPTGRELRTSASAVSAGERSILVRPASWNSAAPAGPLVVHCHGALQSATEIFGGGSIATEAVADALLRAGCVVAGGDQGGDTFGNLAARRWLAELVAAVPYSRLVLTADSMGGLLAANAIADGLEVAGLVGWEPFLQLHTDDGGAWWRTEGTEFADAFRAAYGIAADYSDLAAKAGPSNPMLRAESAFTGLQAAFWASPDDTTVSKVENTDAFAARLAHVATIRVHEARGFHNDPSHYDPAAVAAFVAFVLAPPPTVAVVRERMPLGVHVTGVAPNGHTFRWGRDEPDPANRPSGMRWSDTMPGGFDRFGCTLPRKPGVDYSDLERLSTLTVRDVSGGTVWEGRLERAPRTSGEQMSVSPDAVGWQAHLEDDRSASVIFIDRDLGRWQGPGAQRRLITIDNNTPHQQDPSQSWDTGLDAAALVMSVNGRWVSPYRPRAEAWYDAGAGNRIGSIAASWSGWNDAQWVLRGAVSVDATASATENLADVYTAATGSFDFRPVARHRFGVLVWEYATTNSGGDGAQFDVKLMGLRVVGAHGLLLQGTGADAGIIASDAVAYTIGRWAPLLRFSVGTGGTITPTSFVIPQAAFRDPTTAAAILAEVIKYELPDWAVWDNRTFWMHPRGARGRRWCARVAPSGLEEAGPQIDRVWNGILVQFQDVDGSTRTVGPPGSGVDVEDQLLLDRDPTNPANALNMRRWDVLNMGMVSTPQAAIQVGARFLQEARQLSTAGQARIVGYVLDENGVEWPYHQVRAGDTIRFVDSNDPSPRRITQADKDDASRSCTVSLDSPPQGLDALLARLGVSLAPYGL